MSRQTVYLVEMFVPAPAHIDADGETKTLKLFTNRKSAFQYAITQLDDDTVFDVEDDYDRVDWELVKLVPKNKIAGKNSGKERNTISITERHVYHSLEELEEFENSGSEHSDENPFDDDESGASFGSDDESDEDYEEESDESDEDYESEDCEEESDNSSLDIGPSDDDDDEEMIAECATHTRVQQLDQERKKILRKISGFGTQQQIDCMPKGFREEYDDLVADANRIWMQCLKEEKVDLKTDWRNGKRSEYYDLSAEESDESDEDEDEEAE